MAQNPPVSHAGVPLRLEEEYILLERKGIDIAVKVEGMKKLDGKGKVFLTSARLVFTSNNLHGDFKAFDMPLALMYKLDFKQPIFGSNYLEMYCKPLYNMIPKDAYIKVWFTEGGCDKFLRIFDVARKQVREQLRQGRTYHDNTYNQQIAQGFFNNQAYHDPNDPTVVYTNQPKETFSNTTQFHGQNYYQPAGMQQPQQPKQPQQNYQQPQQGYNNNQVGQQQNNYNQGMQPNQQAPNTNYPAPNTNYPDAPPEQNQMNTNYPSEPQTPMQQGVPLGQNQQPYTVGMNNVPAYNVNQPGVSYYFGVPIGPTVQRNN